MHIQRGHEGKYRPGLKGLVEPKIRKTVEAIAAENNCSYSFVVNTILGRALGIRLEEGYDEIKKRGRKGTRKRKTR